MSTIDWRKIIREQLELLASEAKQLAYERDVPHVDVTVELLCGWFDDSYHPTDGGFCECFSQEELEAMRGFNKLYSELSSGLPESHGTVRTWLNSAAWREVMSEAASTLQRIAA